MSSYTGIYSSYPGDSGYVVDIYYEDDYAFIVDQLKENKWIDDNTRALLIRFTVRNNWNDRFLYVEADIELPTGQNMATHYYINSLSIARNRDEIIYFLIAGLIINTLIFAVKIVFEMSIGMNIVTNIFEIFNCILIIAM